MLATTNNSEAAPSESLTVAVVSDLHAHNSSTDVRPSHLCVTDPEDRPQLHPIAGLLKLIDDQHLEADMLLCAGDFGDKACVEGIKHGWQAVHRLGVGLNAKLVVGTTGNHDVDSRFHDGSYDAREALQALKPGFPIDDPDSAAQFWAHHFAVVSRDAYRVVILDSTAFHGTQPAEIEHGRVSDATLTRLAETLEGGSVKPVNILLCHHHPQQLSELGLGETDFMRNGQLLLDQLGSGRFGSWLVIHGHKHLPKVSYASGGASSAVIFSAGSLCAQLLDQLGTRARNQFYILRIPYGAFSIHGFVGTFSAWDWRGAYGWHSAGTASGLPAVGGFGFRGNVGVLASTIAALVVDSPISWSEVRERRPEVDYVLPQDMEVLIGLLKKEHNVGLLTDPSGNFRHLERMQ